MHGRLKIKTTEQKREEKRREDVALCQKLTEMWNEIREKRANKIYDVEGLRLTGKILLNSPDFYTLWNIRREILIHLKDQLLDDPEETIPQSDSDIIEDDNCDIGRTRRDKDKRLTAAEKFSNLCHDELELTISCLRVQPKSYGTWHHRSYIVQIMPSADFETEIKLCDHYLGLDERNFHCWDYRRMMCNLGKIGIENELEFTEKMINSNFSNFSSFYYRSTLLKQASDKNLINLKEIWPKEYERTLNALFVDPNDQTPWFYYKWLISILQDFHREDPESARNSNIIPPERFFIEEQKLDDLKLLQSLEPGNKWINLIMTFFESDEKKDFILEKLQKIDPLRRNYYQDQRESSKKYQLA